MSLLQVKNLSHSFEYPLFENINFSLNPQQSIAVVGVSGSGKSTLLHICATLLKPQSGEVFLLEKNLYSLDSSSMLEIRRKEIGIIFQAHYLFKGFNTFENIELATLLNETSFDNALLKRLGIENLMHKKVGELSGGQQQRVSIARVLSKKPKILFADEPTGNLDNKTANEVMDVIFEYLQDNDAALFLVTHDKTLAKRCDELIEFKMKNVEE